MIRNCMIHHLDKKPDGTPTVLHLAGIPILFPTGAVESADLDEEQAREKTAALTDYATGQARIGQPISLEELSAMLDEDSPKAFFDHIRNCDYGLAPEIPADKRTLNQFRRFTGRTAGLTISFEAHLLGTGVEFDEAAGVLTIRNVPTQLREQLKRAKA